MTCPVCGSHARVIQTGQLPKGVWRRRKCKSCGHLFHTVEAMMTRTQYAGLHIQTHSQKPTVSDTFPQMP